MVLALKEYLGRMCSAQLGLWVVLLPMIFSACAQKAQTIGWKIDTREVLAAPAQNTDSVQVGVYIDGTASMAGYVKNNDSRYVRFLDELEASIQTAWKRADVHFFRFGNATKEVDRTGFIDARKAAFYADPDLSTLTAIDKAIDCRPGPRVVVVVTDLFQSDGDVIAIVERIKERCFRHGISAAVLGVMSEFDGTVSDAKVPPYRYTSTPTDSTSMHPFYALMFGAEGDLDRLFQSLRNQRFVSERNFTRITNHVVTDFHVALTKPRDNLAMNADAPSGPNQFNVRLRKNNDSGDLLAEVQVTPAPNTPEFLPDRIELAAFRRTAGASKDSVVTNDITLTKLVLTGGKLVATLHVHLTDPPGVYSYAVLLRTGAINGFSAPNWVGQYSSDNPAPGHEANRTINLAKFVTDLRRASSSVEQPPLAKFYLVIRRL